MKKGRTLAAIILMVIFVMITLGACTPAEKAGDTSDNTATPVKNVKLRFLSCWNGEDNTSNELKSLLAEFAKQNPGVEIINDSVAGADFVPKLQTDFASGDNPDVFGVWPSSLVRALVRANKVADLTGTLENDKEWKDSFKKDAWSLTSYGGKIYGLPLEIIFEGIYVNKDLFENCGAKIPETYEELKKAVVTLKKNGTIPIAYNSYPEGTFLYQGLIAMLGGKENVENPFKDGKTNRYYIEAMNYVKELYQLGAFPKNAFTITDGERNNLFASKKAAMLVQGSWISGAPMLQNDTVDIIPIPRLEKGSKGQAGHKAMIYGVGGGNFHMSKVAWDDENKRELCIKLLKALTSKKFASALAAKSKMLSNVKIDTSGIKYNHLVKKALKLLDDADELVGPPDYFVDRTAWEEVVVKRFPYVLEGKDSPEAVWEAAFKKSIMSY